MARPRKNPVIEEEAQEEAAPETIKVESTLPGKLDICGLFFEFGETVNVPVSKLKDDRFESKFRHALKIGVLEEV